MMAEMVHILEAVQKYSSNMYLSNLTFVQASSRRKELLI
jgi:hypothetical protein